MTVKKVGSGRALVISCAVALSCMLVMLLFPLGSGKTVWKGYRVLVVSPAKSEAEIVSRLDRAGITDYITEANALLDDSSAEEPFQPKLEGINNARSRWFSDQERDCRFVFLKGESRLERKIDRAFQGSSLHHYLEKTSNGTRVQALALGILLAVAFFTRPRKSLFTVLSAPFFVLGISDRGVPGFLSSVVMLFGILELMGTVDSGGLGLTARQTMKIVQKRLFPLALFPIGIALASLSGLQGGLLSLLSLFAAVALVLPGLRLSKALSDLRDETRLHPRFEPVAITAGIVHRRGATKTHYALAIAALVTTAVGLPIVLLQAPPRETSSRRVLYIPAPSRYTRHAGFGIEGYTELRNLRGEASLPDLGTFVSARWITKTSPWRRIQDPVAEPESGATADYAWYSADDNGIVTGRKKTMYTFDTAFIRKTLAADGTRLEKMLLGQGRFVTVELTRLE